MMSCPPTVTRPSDGVTMPQTMPISVVLPAPFGPSRAKISPLRISRLMFLSAWNPDAYVLERCEMDTTGGMGMAATGNGQRMAAFETYLGKVFLELSGLPGWVPGPAERLPPGPDALVHPSRLAPAPSWSQDVGQEAVAPAPRRE